MSARNEPQSRAELERWADTIATMRQCDQAAGITDPGTVAATAALVRACEKQGVKG